jgi:hypothetical protein
MRQSYRMVDDDAGREAVAGTAVPRRRGAVHRLETELRFM